MSASYHASPHASSHKERFLPHFLIAAAELLVLIASDQITKAFAMNDLPGHPLYLIPGILHLEYVENRGAAFGILQGKQPLFTVITLFFLAAILYACTRIPGTKRFTPARFFLIMLLAGASGNLLDRLRLHYVRDFIYFVPIDFPVFNLADMYVVISAGALAALMLFVYKEDELNGNKPQ